MSIADVADKILCRLLPRRDIWKVVDGERRLYLRRWFLKKSARDRAGEEGDSGGVFLHRILRSDDDRDPHDHPWDFTTVILAGGYEDEQWDRAAGSRTFRKFEEVTPGTIVRRPAEHLHRVRLVGGREAWTLVFTGPRRRTWGFMTESGWKKWREYLGL